MKLYQRILLAPAVAVFGVIALAAAAAHAFGTQQAAMEEIFEVRFAFYQQATRVSLAIDEVHASVYRTVTWIGLYDEAKLVAVTADLGARIDRAAALAQELSARGAAQEERALLAKILEDVGRYRKSMALALDLASVDVNSGLAALQTADLAFQDLRKRVDALVEVERRLAQERYEGAGEAAGRANQLALVISLLAAAGALAAGAWTTRSVTREMGESPATRRRSRAAWRRGTWASPSRRAHTIARACSRPCGIWSSGSRGSWARCGPPRRASPRPRTR